MKQSQSWLDRAPGPRGGGAILFGSGVLSFYLALLSPFLSHRAPSYWPQLPLAMASIPLLFVGFALILFGQTAADVIGNPRKPMEWKPWLTVPLLCISAFAFYWLRSRAAG